jgi:hypothetical protein
MSNEGRYLLFPHKIPWKNCKKPQFKTHTTPKNETQSQVKSNMKTSTSFSTYVIATFVLGIAHSTSNISAFAVPGIVPSNTYTSFHETKSTLFASSDHEEKGLIGKTKEKVVDAASAVKEKAVDAKDYVKEKAVDAKDYVKDKAGDVKDAIVGHEETAEEKWEKAKDKFQDARQSAEDSAHNAGEQVSDSLDEASDKLKQAREDAKEATKKAYEESLE